MGSPVLPQNVTNVKNSAPALAAYLLLKAGRYHSLVIEESRTPLLDYLDYGPGFWIPQAGCDVICRACDAA